MLKLTPSISVIVSTEGPSAALGAPAPFTKAMPASAVTATIFVRMVMAGSPLILDCASRSGLPVGDAVRGLWSVTPVGAVAIATFKFFPDLLSNETADERFDLRRHGGEVNRDGFVAVRRRTRDLAIQRAGNVFAVGADEQHFQIGERCHRLL